MATKSTSKKSTPKAREVDSPEASQDIPLEAEESKETAAEQDAPEQDAPEAPQEAADAPESAEDGDPEETGEGVEQDSPEAAQDIPLAEEEDLDVALPSPDLKIKGKWRGRIGSRSKGKK